ncbi:BgTH12-07461 [Blumeria graminis f. sp. triticale]|uniref:Phosphatidylglycerol/phosphatidylinositol transfer protein n=3 Tax=Blumeria graminis TaxID=34373 RepID=A0A9X9L9Z7_BLUGR|nr:hypothetical protein BGT96224_ASP21338 [Blumeria graminis f. sp. tritici 96224]CAD6500281.1 BgTH12-07461 [Blumeria graminis f. sp. triticale]VCU40530.1 BgtASP-21338 [Blumeria graminis f. sp. tritici]
MRLTIRSLAWAVSSLLCAYQFESVAGISSDESQKIISNDNKIPGNSPVAYCISPENSILTIKSVILTPSTPIPGQKLKIEATGDLSEDIIDGASVKVQAKVGYITLLTLTLDLCNEITKIGESCPLKKGTHNITREVDIPQYIPAGSYKVSADVESVDHTQITCLEATIRF